MLVLDVCECVCNLSALPMADEKGVVASLQVSAWHFYTFTGEDAHGSLFINKRLKPGEHGSIFPICQKKNTS